jgi:hypothetical protein
MFQANQAAARNRDALAAIVAMLISMVGLTSNQTTTRISQNLRLEVLRILRPAEAAVRRLIFIAAQGLVPKPATQKPAGFFSSFRKVDATKPRRATFNLSDPRPPMIGHDVVCDAASGNVTLATRAPRISSIAPIDPTIPALFAAQRAQVKTRTPKDANQTQTLINRLQAIRSALKNIPREAQRLARWTARRERIAKQRLVYTSPLRVGPPPGYRKEPVHEVDRILAECHLRAYDARRLRQQPNTS